MKKIVRDIFTGKDNATYDGWRIIVISASFVAMAMAVIETLFGHGFKPLEMSGAITSLLVGGGGGIFFKSNTEPEKKGEDHV